MLLLFVVDEVNYIGFANMNIRNRNIRNKNIRNRNIIDDEDDEEEEKEIPSPAFITKKLLEQGVTMEQLVTALLSYHEEYDENAEIRQTEDVIYEKIHIVISNYEGEDQDQEINF